MIKVKQNTWHPQQETLLRDWAEMSSGYRWLHDTAYRKFKRLSLKYTIPVIVMSTVTGTANFAQESFPLSWQTYVPMVIGLVNLIAAIMTTVSQFLKVNELMEGSRVAGVSFGKLTRNITVELNLPHEERTSDGPDFLRLCQGEYDRLIEQSPPIPKDVISMYKETFIDDSFARPEIIQVKKVNIFKDTVASTGAIIANAATTFQDKRRESKFKIQQEQIARDIEMQAPKLKSIKQKIQELGLGPISNIPNPFKKATSEPVVEPVVEPIVEPVVEPIVEPEPEPTPEGSTSLKSLFE